MSKDSVRRTCKHLRASLCTQAHIKKPDSTHTACKHSNNCGRDFSAPPRPIRSLSDATRELVYKHAATCSNVFAGCACCWTGQTAAWRWTESTHTASAAAALLSDPLRLIAQLTRRVQHRLWAERKKRHPECDEAPVPFPGDHRRAGGFGPGHQRHHLHCRPRHDHPRHKRPFVDFDHAENDHRLGKRYLVASADFSFSDIYTQLLVCWCLICNLGR